MARRSWMSLLVTPLLLIACGGGLKLKLINASARQPSNVAVYFAVDTADGKPVPGLASDKFTIYEDEQKVSEFESKQTILNPKIAAAHYSLLLVDMSGSIVEAKQSDKVADAAQKFVARVEKHHKVAVSAFDGSTELTPIAPFAESGASAKAAIDKLRTFKPKDPSTNLNGAVVAGLKELRKALDAESKPLKFGTLIVFTDGTDRAARVSKEKVQEEIKKPEYKDFEIFAIGVGAEMADARLEEIGKSGTVKEKDSANTEKAFDDIATRIEGAAQRFYLLSYCTPSRAGEHEVRIEAKSPDGKTGSMKHKFKATGFGPNCDPQTPPDFDLSRPVVKEDKPKKK